jgi:hypothetical protein
MDVDGSHPTHFQFGHEREISGKSSLPLARGLPSPYIQPALCLRASPLGHIVPPDLSGRETKRHSFVLPGWLVPSFIRPSFSLPSNIAQ